MVMSSLNNPNMPTAMSALAILAGVSMTLGGAALISQGVRVRRDMVERRVQLIHPLSTQQERTTARALRTEETELVRHSFYGLPEREQREIMHIFSGLGIAREHTLAFFNGLRLFLALSLGALALLVVAKTTFLGTTLYVPTLVTIALIVMGWMAPLVYIRLSARTRADAAAAGFPDALELLVVCVEAGLALEDGIDRIVIELRSSRPELAEELAVTSADLKILPSRTQALMNLADRIDAPSVRSVVSTLSQTLRYGTPLAQAMRVVAADMRNDSLMELEQKANRLPVLMTIPMMLFIMPTIFLIVGGPAALRLMDHFLH